MPTWDELCKQEEFRWREPDQEVVQFAELLKEWGLRGSWTSSQEEGAILLSDDRGLLRRAMRAGLRALHSPDLLLMLWRGGSLEAEQYRLLLLQLEAEKRIDRATMQSYLELGGEK
jgi:hypothetical protein